MRIALTGGSGFIGGHLVEKLVSEGHNVRVLVRETSNTKLLQKLGAELVYGDVTNKKPLPRLVNGADVVYHLAARIYWGSKDEFWNVNYHGTKNMLEACVHKSLHRFVFTSTVGVMGSITDPPADETHPYNPMSPYERAKCEAEKTVLQYHRQYDIPVTIVRPAVVYGPRNMYHLKLCRWIKRWNLLIGDMNNWAHLSYIDDLLEGMTLAAEKSKAIGEVYIIAGDKPITWREYFHLIAEAVGVNPAERQIPLWMIKAVARLFEVRSKIFGNDPAITRSWVEEVTKNFAYDISKARRHLGYNPKIPLKEGISRTIEWYMQNGFLR